MADIKGFFGEYRWLSNYWPCTINYHGVTFPSVEHAYQAIKTTDGIVRESIFAVLPSPSLAKRLGNNIKLRDDWEQIKLDVMENLLIKKFSDKNPELKQKLIETGDCYLEETNTWNDVFWGICKGKGENHLGKLLMKIRLEISKESKV